MMIYDDAIHNVWNAVICLDFHIWKMLNQLQNKIHARHHNMASLLNSI